MNSWIKTYDAIYDEMMNRNEQKLKQSGFQWDAILKNAWKDGRQCLAIYKEICPTDVTPAFKNVIRIIDSLSNCIVSYIPAELYASSGLPSPPPTHATGVLHTTFMQLRTFGSEEVGGTNDWSIIKSYLKPTLPLTIIFHRICITPSSIVVLGIPSRDINKDREKIRDNLPVIEPYKCDIVHATLARFHSNPSLETQQKINALNQWNKNNDKFLFKSTIDQWNIGKASWKVHPYECDVLFTVE